MKRNDLFEKCLAKVDPAIKAEVGLNIDIANRISDILKAKGMSQRQFANSMGKRESEISRWLSGSHGFTTATLARIEAALGEPIIQVAHPQPVEQPSMRIYLALDQYATFGHSGRDSFLREHPNASGQMIYSQPIKFQSSCNRAKNRTLN